MTMTASKGNSKRVSEPTLYPTAFRSPQLELIELDDEQWRKFQRRPASNYAKRIEPCSGTNFPCSIWGPQHSFLGLKSHMKGGEIVLPTCVHCHVANSTALQAAAAGTAQALTQVAGCGPAPPCIGAATSASRRATAAGGGATAAARRLGRDLRGHPHPPRPGDAGHHDCRAARDQPSDRVRVSAADPAPESPQPAAVRPGVAAVHGVSDPALAGGVYGQHAALARDAGAGLCALRPDGLAVHHPAAAGERRRLGARDADLALHPPAGAVGPGGLVHLGVLPKRSGRRTRSCMSTN